MVWRVGEVINGRGSPITLTTKHHSNIFAVAFSCDNHFIFSGGKLLISQRSQGWLIDFSASAGNDSDAIKHDFET